MKKLSVLFAVILIALTSCSKKDKLLTTDLNSQEEISAEFKVSFTVAESQSVKQYNVVLAESANGEYKTVGIAFPESGKPESTFDIPVKYTGKAKVLFFKVVAVNEDGSTFDSKVESIIL